MFDIKRKEIYHELNSWTPYSVTSITGHFSDMSTRLHFNLQISTTNSPTPLVNLPPQVNSQTPVVNSPTSICRQLWSTRRHKSLFTRFVTLKRTVMSSLKTELILIYIRFDNCCKFSFNCPMSGSKNIKCLKLFANHTSSND